jgi:hypothetical protein
MEQPLLCEHRLRDSVTLHLNPLDFFLSRLTAKKTPPDRENERPARTCKRSGFAFNSTNLERFSLDFVIENLAIVAMERPLKSMCKFQCRGRDVWPKDLIEDQDNDLRVLELQSYMLAVK